MFPSFWSKQGFFACFHPVTSLEHSTYEILGIHPPTTSADQEFVFCTFGRKEIDLKSTFFGQVSSWYRSSNRVLWEFVRWDVEIFWLVFLKVWTDIHLFATAGPECLFGLKLMASSHCPQSPLSEISTTSWEITTLSWGHCERFFFNPNSFSLLWVLLFHRPLQLGIQELDSGQVRLLMKHRLFIRAWHPNPKPGMPWRLRTQSVTWSWFSLYCNLPKSGHSSPSFHLEPQSLPGWLKTEEKNSGENLEEIKRRCYQLWAVDFCALATDVCTLLLASSLGEPLLWGFWSSPTCWWSFGMTRQRCKGTESARGVFPGE